VSCSCRRGVGIRHGRTSAAVVSFELAGSGDPERCIARGDAWIFGPEAPYERSGDVGNVAFPCGYTIGADGDSLNVYYGAADTSVALATGSITELLRWLDLPTFSSRGFQTSE
jgi:predicted GH43/DUF377 family glycosyl hydrolase